MKNLKYIFRIFQIIYVLLKHNILLSIISILILQKRKIYIKGENLAKSLEELGPIFIKLGQTLSTRPDIIGVEFARSLSMLQDKLPPFDRNIAIKTIETELDQKIDDCFSFFDQQPVAAASIAQVYKGITVNGRIVAVKILRPNIEELFRRDLNLFKAISKFIHKNFSKYKRLKLPQVVNLFEKTTKIELDLRFEAAASSEFRENMKDEKNIYIPEIHWEMTSRRILTSEWIDLIRIDDKEGIKACNINPLKAAETIAVTFFNSAYRDGFFHADLHPGNIFLNKLGQVVFLDFGIMGRLEKHDRIYVAEILNGFLKRDYLLVAKIHIKAGYIPKDQSVEIFAQACRSIGEPIIGLPVSKISIAKLLSQLFEITREFNMETQPQLLMLQKTMMMVEGIGLMLNPEVNMWSLAEPWIEDWAKKNIGFDSKIVNFINNMIDKIDKSEKIDIKEEKYKIIIIKARYKFMHILFAFTLLSLLLIILSNNS